MSRTDISSQWVSKPVEKKLNNLSINRFYDQITEHFIQGAKHFYNIGLLVKEANENLNIDEQNKLKERLGFQKSQWSKFLTIGKSPICKKLTKLKKMPEAWTTAYYIAKQDEKAVYKNMDLINVTTTRQQAEIIFKGLPQTSYKPKTVYDNYKVPFKSFEDCFLISCKNDQRSYVRGNDFLNLKKELQEVVDKFNESKKENLVHISPRVSNWKLGTQNKGGK
jgi:hypothetical protein